MDLDLAQWQPLISDKMFLPWLVKVPGEQDVLRSRQLSTVQANRLEELWKTNPDAGLDDVDRPGEDDEARTRPLTHTPQVERRLASPLYVEGMNEMIGRGRMTWPTL